MLIFIIIIIIIRQKHQLVFSRENYILNPIV